MTITRELTQKRLDALKSERQMILDNVNAYNGAIQECERVLLILDKPEPEAETNGRIPAELLVE